MIGKKTRKNHFWKCRPSNLSIIFSSPLLLNRINHFQELAVSPSSNMHWFLSVWRCTLKGSSAFLVTCITSQYVFLYIFQLSFVQTLHLNHEYVMTTTFQQIILTGYVHHVAVAEISHWHLAGPCKFRELLDKLPDCQRRGLPHHKICNMNHKVNWRTNK